MGKLRSNAGRHLLERTLNDLTGLPHARVLDVGAGDVVKKNRELGLNDLADCYLRLMARQQYIALEIDPSRNAPVLGDAHFLPFPDQSMDAVLMVSVLEHLYDPIQAAEEAYRVLKPGGAFFSNSVFYYPHHDSPHDYFRFTADGYRYLLRRFSSVELVSAGNYISVVNDVLAYHLQRAGRPGRLLARAVELPLRIPFYLFDSRLPTDVAVGFAARACK